MILSVVLEIEKNRFVRYYHSQILSAWLLPVCKYGGGGPSEVMCRLKKEHEGQCWPNTLKLFTVLTLPQLQLFNPLVLGQICKGPSWGFCAFFYLPDNITDSNCN